MSVELLCSYFVGINSLGGGGCSIPARMLFPVLKGYESSSRPTLALAECLHTIYPAANMYLVATLG